MAHSHMAARCRVSQWITLLCIGTFLLSMQHHTSHSLFASAQQVTVTPTTLRCTTNGGGGCTDMVVEKSISLLNGAIDYTGILTINTTHVVTIIASGVSPLSIAAGVSPTSYTTMIFVEAINISLRNASSSSSSSTVTNVQGVTAGVVVPTATLTTSSIPPFLDEVGNPWTLPPLPTTATTTASTSARTITITFNKANTKVRFTMQRALVKSYYPVSEYMFQVPSDATLCTSGTSAAAAAGYKCCLISASSSATGSAYYEVYSLSSAVEPTTCTVNASIVYLDHYHTMEVGYVWWGTKGATGGTVYRGGMWYQGSIGLVAKGDARSALVGLTNSTSPGVVSVSRDATILTFSTSASDQQLCRNGGFLSNAAQPEPFLVNNYAFGYSSRQIGYNITQYVVDRQCNGAPLGYYTSNNGNNSDQFSSWRARTTTYVFVPLAWRNDLATITPVATGLTVYYGDYFSMSDSTGPATSALLIFSPSSSSTPALRPGFVTIVLLSSAVSIPTRINATFASLSHSLQLTSSPQYTTSSGTHPSPAGMNVVASCNIVSQLSSVVQSASWTTTLTTSSSSFPIVIGWTFATPVSLPSSSFITCTYTITRTDISAPTITTSTTPQSISTLVTSMSDEVVANLILPVIIAANISHMALYATQYIPALPTSYFTVSTISAQQCPMDYYYSLWVGVCDLMTDALCSNRYPPQVGATTTGRPLMDSTLSKCVPNSASLTSLGTTESSLLAARQRIFQTLYQSLVWRNGADSGGPTGIIDGLVSMFTSTPTPTTAPSSISTTITPTQLHIAVPSWQFNGTLFVSLIDGSVTSTRPSASAVPNASLVMIILTRNTSTTPTTGGGSGTGSDWWVTSVAIAVSKLPFTGKAVAGLVLLLLAALSLLLILFVWVRLRAWLPWGEDAAAVWGWVQDKRPTWNGIKQKATVVCDMFHAMVDRWKAYRQARREAQKAQRKSERRSRRRRSANADGNEEGNEYVVDVNNNHADDGGEDTPSSAHVGQRVLTWLRSLGGRREPPLPTRRSSRKPSTSSSSRASRSSTAERRRQRDSVTDRNAPPRQRTRREESPDLVDSGGDGAGAEMQQRHSPTSHQPDNNNIVASHHHPQSEAFESSTRLLKYTHSNRYQQQQRNTEPPPPTTGQHTQLLHSSSVVNPHHYQHRDDAYEDRRHTLSPPDGIDEDVFHPRQDDRYGQHRNNVIASAPPAASPQIADSVVEYHEPFENVVQQQQHQQLPRRQHLTSSSHHAESSHEVQLSQCYDFHRAATQHASELSARNNSSRLKRQSSSRRGSTNSSVALMTVDELPPRSPSTRSHHMPSMYSTPPRDESRHQRRLAVAAVVRHLDYEHSSSSFGVGATADAAPRRQEERADADVIVTTSQRPASTPRQGELLHTRSLSTHQDEQQRGAQQHKHKEDSRRQVHSRVHPDPHHQRNYVGGSDYSLLSTINVVPPSLSGDEAASSPSPRKKQHDAPRSAPQLYNEVENPRSMPSAVYVQSPERSHVRRHRRQTASAEMPAPPPSIVRQALEAEEVAEQPPPLPRTAATSVATSTHHRPHTSSSSTKQRLGADSHFAEEGRRNNRPSSPASQVVQSSPPEGGMIQQSQREPSPAEVVQRFLAATSLRDKTPSSLRGSDDDDDGNEPAHHRHHQGQGPQPNQTSLQAPPRLNNEHSRRVDPPTPPLTLDGGSDIGHNRPRRCG